MVFLEVFVKKNQKAIMADELAADAQEHKS